MKPGARRHASVEAADLTLEDDGTIVVRVKDVDMTAERMSAILDERRAAFGAHCVPLLIDARRVRSMTREAQELTARPDSKEYTACLALLVDSAVSVVLVNFFMVFVRPPYPTRMFRSEDAARAWLRETRASGGAPR